MTRGYLSCMASNAKTPSKATLTTLWSAEVLKAGFVAVPKAILVYQRELDLDPGSLNVLLHLLKHWFRKDRLPFPSKTSIAEAMGVTPRTVQRHLAKLEAVGLIQRMYRPGKKGGKASQTSLYSFDGLITRIETLVAQEEPEPEKEAAQ